MILVIFQLFGFVCFCTLLLTCSSRYLSAVVLRLLTAHRCGLVAYHEERKRSLDYAG